MPGRPGWMGGTSDYHAPVALPGGPELLGQFACVVGQRVENGWIWGCARLPKPPGMSRRHYVPETAAGPHYSGS